MKINVVICVLYLLPLTRTSGQSIVKGLITDENGTAVPGANIYILDSYDGTASLPDGAFEFETEKSGTNILVASAVGYTEYRDQIDLDDPLIRITIVLSEEVQQLDDLVITAGVFDASDEKKSVILKPLDIVTTAGATADIPGVLNTLPGTQTVGEKGRLFVRGGDDRETRYFIDGIEVSQPYGLTPVNIPSRMRFSPFLFSGTTFSTGGYSSEFGQALSGTLNLKTDEEALQTQTDLSFMSVGGGISHTRKWEKNSLFVESFYTDLTPYFWLVPQNTDWTRAPFSWQNTIMFRQKTGKNGRLKVFYTGETSKMQVRQPFPPDVSEKVDVDLSNRYHYLNANYKNTIGQYWLIETGISNSWIGDEIILEDYGSKSDLSSLHFKFTSILDKGKAVNLKLGSDIRHYKYTEVISDHVENQLRTGNTSEVNPAIYIESNIIFSKRLIGVVGGRLEYMSLPGQALFSPRISMALKTGDFSQMSLAAGFYHQRPSFTYMIYNRRLEDERATHYILNYQYAKEMQTFRIEAYYKDYRHLIRFDREGIDLPENIRNEGYGFAGGLDVFWRDGKTFRHVDYWLSYSFLKTRRLFKDYPEYSIPEFASEHNFSFVYKHFIQQIRTQIGVTYSFASGRPYNDPNVVTFNSKHTPAYHDLSMNFSYLVRSSFIIHFSVTNVLGVENIFGYQYSLVPDESGVYSSIPIGLPAKRFIFLGVFVTLSKDKNSNQLRNL